MVGRSDLKGDQANKADNLAFLNFQEQRGNISIFLMGGFMLPLSKEYLGTIKSKINLKKIYSRLMEPYCIVFCRFFICMRSLVIFWPIFTCNMAMESQRHVEHACFVYFKKSQKMKALGQKMLIFLLFYVARSFFNRFLHVIWLWKAIDMQITPVLFIFKYLQK